MHTFTVAHPFPLSETRFWGEVFLDEAYNTALYTEGLGFGFEQLSLETAADGTISRSIRVIPALDLPKAARKVMGDRISYIEQGTFDPVDQRWRFALTPSKLAEKIKVSGEFWSTPDGDEGLNRHCKTDISVKIFGVGGVVEKAVEKAFRESYQKAAAFTAEWLQRS
ncbi:MAG: DUF2505 domain-containing protein [Bradymonadia bacterium]